MGVEEGSAYRFLGVSEDIDKKQLKEVQAWWGKVTVSVLDIINICCCETFTWGVRGTSGNMDLVLRMGVWLDCTVRVF